MERKLSGRCHCGRVSYVVTGEPIAVGHCYCRNCQRLSGAGHSSGALFRESSFELTGGPPTEYAFETAPGITDTRLFCPTCGSNVLGKNSAAPGLMSLSLGSLDDASALPPHIGIYTKQKTSWDLLDDKIRNLEGSAAGLVKLPSS